MTEADVIIVGAGPAGIAAALAAAQHNRSVILLDDNRSAGGQIWRDGLVEEKDPIRAEALRKLQASGANLMTRYRVVDVGPQSTLLAVHDVPGATALQQFRYKKLVIATGARERFLPFPGWTSPGVFGVGGLQALVKGGFSVKGKRVVVAGSGPLLLAVAAHLREYGAEIICVAEQASLARLARFGLGLWSHTEKIRQGLHFRKVLGKTPYRAGCWPTAAQADSTKGWLSSTTLTNGSKTWQEQCDLLACGFHLVPNTELASLLGCALNDGFVQVDEEQRTSLPDIYCAGEPTGIAGLDAALLQGEIAGRSCTGQPTKSLQRRSAGEVAFGLRLKNTFALRPELRKLAKPDTIVCRCEDVPYQLIANRSGWTDAKLQTRCGMGPCQGRVCGPAIEALFGWAPNSIRPPLFPIPVSAFGQTQLEESVR